jgi:hypothetical protein
MQRVQETSAFQGNQPNPWNKQLLDDVVSKSQVHPGYKGILEIMKERDEITKKAEKLYREVQAKEDDTDDEGEGRSIH